MRPMEILPDTLPPRRSILVVDDFEDWRVFTSKALRDESDLDIVGQVSDGLEAVRQAENLRPDVILLDISLPTLNGIEVARRIQQVAPGSIL